ncbi:DegV family protein [Staphylococcus chromogenes]|uniref:DegV family protein n=1 Tax=Staphylococcus chromogenes TaxID=46126 RepID=UPI001E3F4210|nr:DegV family protein [Staphylococcus chromogenes]MCD8906024.1 DegV family protein [Staphylococcus chromogenes]
MGKIAFLTDSTSGILRNELKDVFVVPLGTNIGGVEYIDNIDLSTDQFYEILKTKNDGAKSFQPSPKSFHEVYQKIINCDYEHIIAIHPSSELTGTYQQSVAISQDYDIDVTVIDSRIGDYPIRRMIEEGIKAIKMGKTYSFTVKMLKDLVNKSRLILYPENLQQLMRSGRLSRSQAIIAGMLNIQLITEFEKGKLIPIKKTRTKKKAWDFISQKIVSEISEDNPSKIGVSYAGDRKASIPIIKFIKDTFPEKIVECYPLVPVAGVHTGYGTIAISWIKA